LVWLLRAALRTRLHFGPTPESSVHTVKYTFTGSCDGLTLAQNTNGTATGFHTGACAGNQYAGGVRGVVNGKNSWIIMTNTSDTPSNFEMFVLDESALTFKLYVMTNGLQTFSESASGTLTRGAPKAVQAFGKPLKSSSGAIVTK
jgi:hypothetical protein